VCVDLGTKPAARQVENTRLHRKLVDDIPELFRPLVVARCELGVRETVRAVLLEIRVPGVSTSREERTESESYLVDVECVQRARRGGVGRGPIPCRGSGFGHGLELELERNLEERPI
jgi:hypothetical protein